jgi:hypothetical protein
MKAITEWARQQGCDVQLSRGHWRITYQGRLVGAIASSPGDPRAVLNARSFLRRNLAKIKEGQP